MSRINIKLLTYEQLQSRLVELGLKKYRADQILAWIYQRFAASFDAMTNIAKSERALLADQFSISKPTILKIERSTDGTRKFLFELEDRRTIESVLIPDEDRQTLCISSQVGCRQGCRFCFTARGGFTRNLAAFEISDQVLEIARMLAEEGAHPITNIVLMGMGEPLDNRDEVMRALDVITSETGLQISPRRITLSTSGLVSGIDELGRSDCRVNLAISLNATTDAVRDEIMPINKRWPIRQLLDACRRYPLPPRRRITFEYVLLRGTNDSRDDALRLVSLLRGIPAKINLIPFNPYPGSDYNRPDAESVRRFQAILLDHHLTAPVRESRGRDISAACGQLRGKEADQTIAGVP